MSGVAHVPIESIYTDHEPEPDWLIPNIIHKGSQIVLAALAGTGKSLFCYSLANALATGTQFIGNSSVKRVLYFDEENSQADLSAYARWTWRGLGCPSRDLLHENLRIESLTLGSADNWAVALRSHAQQYKPDLLIIDTATPACRISDENDNAEASIAARQIRLAQLDSAPGCAAIILKHLRLDHDSGHVDVRGAKAWKGAVDAIWYHLSRPGKRRADGWRNTYIRPEKVRAYGLRDTLQIHPVVSPALVKLEITRLNKGESED